MAAFSDANFVVKCIVKSGTIHTVNFAKEYGKQIINYLPDDRPKNLYDVNMFILNNDEDTIKVESFEKFFDFRLILIWWFDVMDDNNPTISKEVREKYLINLKNSNEWR